MAIIENFGHKVGSLWTRFYVRLGDTLGYMGVLLWVAPSFALVVAILASLNGRLYTVSFGETVPGWWFVAAFVASSFFLGTTMVSAYVVQAIGRRRRRRHAFRYDNHTTLFNGNEPNIAFRVPTFQGLVENVTDYIDQAEIDDVLFQVGIDAASDFAQNIEGIMDREFLDGPRWNNLNFSDKLYEWSKYDSATGWGHFVARFDGHSQVAIRVSHYKGLFDNEGGRRFAHFLAGYCQTILTRIVHNSDTEDARDYRFATIRARDPLNADTIQFIFDLEPKRHV